MEEIKNDYIIGVLSPEGIFYECDSYGHLSLAKKLCKELFNQEFYHSVECEDYLIKNGFIIFQYRNVYNNFEEITKEQFEFIKTNDNKLNQKQKKQ